MSDRKTTFSPESNVRRSFGVERVPTCQHQRALQFPPQAFPRPKLESGHLLIHELDPPQRMGPAAPPDTVSIPGISFRLRTNTTWRGKELLAMVVIPPRPVSGAFLQINKLFLSRHVDVLDALLRDTHDASTGSSNPDYLGLVLAHVDFSASYRR